MAGAQIKPTIRIEFDPFEFGCRRREGKLRIRFTP